MSEADQRVFAVLGRETCYRGFFRLEKVRLRHSLFRGGMSSVLTREIVERADVAAVLLYDPDHDKVVMIEQFRVGAVADPQGPWMLEIVAGLIEPGEAPEQVARREALEEAGCVVGAMVPITTFYATPAKSSEKSYLFCGRIDSSIAGGVHGLPHEGEDIRVLAMASTEALDLLEAGRINSAWPMIALMWLATHRSRLRRDWLRAATRTDEEET